MSRRLDQYKNKEKALGRRVVEGQRAKVRTLNVNQRRVITFMESLFVPVPKRITQQKMSAVLRDIVQGDKGKGMQIFTDRIVSQYGIASPEVKRKLMTNTVLASSVARLSNVHSYQLPKAKRQQLIGQVKRSLFPHIKQSKRFVTSGERDLDNYMVDYFWIKKQENIRNRIFATGDKKAISMWLKETSQLEVDHRQGKIKDFKEFLERYEQINGRVIEATGDKELQEQWVTYKNSEERRSINSWFGTSTPENQPMRSGDKPLVSQKDKQEAVTAARNEVNSVPNFEIDTDDQGNALVIIDNEFRIQLALFKEEGSDDFVYYILDENLSGERLRVKAVKLLPALYGRHIDGLFQKFAGSPKFALELSQIPDRDLIKLGKRLLGSGKGKDYEITSEDKTVIERLVKILRNLDPKYASLQSKIDALNHFLTTDARGEQMKKVLLKEKDNNMAVTELISSSGDKRKETS